MRLTRTVLKSVNEEKLREELSPFLVTSLTFEGFDRLSDREKVPFAESSRVVATSGGVAGRTDDVAVRGEVRIVTATTLTAQEQAALADVLTAHTHTALTAEQQRQDQDEADLTTIITTEIGQFRTNLQNWVGMTAAQEKAATREMFLTLGKALRFILRRERGGEI
jgi:hypothetical protein